MGPFYCTVEDVKDVPDIKETARSDAQILRLIDASSRSIDTLCHRRFYPEIATRYFDWPDSQMGRSWRLWLNENELLSVTSILSGGNSVTDYFPEPRSSGPPYNRVEIDLSGSDSFGGGSTFQRDISITGVFGACQDESPGGETAEGLDATETGVDITDSTIGVGSLIRVDSERMIVTGKTLRSTGYTLGSSITANKADVSLSVSDGSAYTVGELLTIDAESMRIVDIAGNTLIVQRAADGSVLAAHNSGTTIYAPRTLTVERGVLGTTADIHLTAADIAVHQVPPLIRELCIAETLATLFAHRRAWAGDGKTGRATNATDLDALRDRVWAAHARKVRKGVI